MTRPLPAALRNVDNRAGERAVAREKRKFKFRGERSIFNRIFSRVFHALVDSRSMKRSTVRSYVKARLNRSNEFPTCSEINFKTATIT